MRDFSLSTVLAAACIAVGMVSSAAVLGRTLVDIRRAQDTLTVTGSAKRQLASDFAVWRASVSYAAPVMKEASAELDRYVERVRGFLKTENVGDADVKWQPVAVMRQDERRPDGTPTGKVAAWELTQSFEMRTPDVQRVTELARKIGDLIREGVPVQSFPIDYLYTKLADLRIEMMAEATADAKARAERIAASAGARVGTIRSARQGVFQLTPRFSTDVSDYGLNDTSSLEKDLTAVVNVTFALD